MAPKPADEEPQVSESHGYSADYSVDDEDQLTGEDALSGDVLEGEVRDELDHGIVTADRYSTDYGNTPWEETHRECIDQRRLQEVPEPDPYATEYEDAEESDDPDGREVGDQRAGRLVDPDRGTGEDTESEVYGTDAGIDGAGASAEEAAMHVIDERAEAERA
ncbi:hypothetical protein GCM10010197_43410 [Nocardioides luteus]|uniref:DUF5709 domain-containing protein n=1 Tax=Nocardioides luteus TaxID=1844 RepID=A0ABQ5T331_9ACTN|nr:hypothetical protein GCM10010197_43410 [Nocardioides luteus]GLJ70700.1 hypothetical protein GCM10017579_47360 [Nocardioides luteus]